MQQKCIRSGMLLGIGHGANLRSGRTNKPFLNRKETTMFSDCNQNAVAALAWPAWPLISPLVFSTSSWQASNSSASGTWWQQQIGSTPDTQNNMPSCTKKLLQRVCAFRHGFAIWCYCHLTWTSLKVFNGHDYFWFVWICLNFKCLDQNATGFLGL